jgi:hypothetical protein
MLIGISFFLVRALMSCAILTVDDQNDASLTQDLAQL